MRLRASLLGFAAIAGLWLGASLARAEDAPPPMPPGGPEFCKQNPAKCEEWRAKRDAFCKANPQRCEELKQRRAEREAFCKQNPQKCEQQRAALKARHEEMQARCSEDPAKCDQIKQQMRERWKEHHPGAPAPSESAPSEPAQ